MDSEQELKQLRAALAVYANPANWHSHTTGHGESATIAFTEPGDAYASGFWLAKEALEPDWKRPKESYGKLTTTNEVSRKALAKLVESLGIEASS